MMPLFTFKGFNNNRKCRQHIHTHTQSEINKAKLENLCKGYRGTVTCFSTGLKLIKNKKLGEKQTYLFKKQNPYLLEIHSETLQGKNAVICF